MINGLLQRNGFYGIFLLALSVVLWLLSADFPRPDNGYPGAALFPRVVGLLLGISGIWLLATSIRRQKRSQKRKAYRVSGGIIRLAVAIVLVASYPLLIQQVHFIPAMAVLIVVFGFLLKNKAWHAVLTATLSAFLIYTLFTRLLGVPL